MVSPLMFEPFTPHPMFEVQMALSGKPAASVQKFRQEIGGSCFSWGIGSQNSGICKKLFQTLRSSKSWILILVEPSVMACATALFKLNLKLLRKGHIEEMKLRRPATDCICRVEAVPRPRMLLIASIVFVLLSSGRPKFGLMC